ncbi:replication protein RepA (plasmid) [Candidatus Pantoea edessiphila]|uniref:Replication protein RepA n=1 Tax=Candidatus Pantoea edessiphila TaxID=2044610 RepID=A0A2P5SX99_9GAMM|nr:RepB family plasmid replication initiator protein [Candidatus Pantoea edessiphila]MBK4775892.1 RepB family plasmid replication initiator protein [Pantoea sp. Edef]PPI86955.1 replication protein RepA [Candidatus Pantoea edessiphila]
MKDKNNENKALLRSFLSVNKNSGEVVQLYPNKNNTVQPAALMRLGLFVPTLKSTARGKTGSVAFTDATKELKNLSLVKAEGYQKIIITGARLDMDNDFKTWAGIIQSFSRYPVKENTVSLSFINFVKMCGIPSANSSSVLRKRLDASLRRIATNTLSFEGNGKIYHTHLVQSAYYNRAKDIVHIQADPKLFELYSFDHKVLLHLRAISRLKRKESAQALYTFLESLPTNPIPISLLRLRMRLNLSSKITTQNYVVRRAMKQLKKIGYLDYSEVKRGRSVFFIIHERIPKLDKIHYLESMDSIIDD